MMYRRRKDNKKGFEVSVNFIVMLILSITALSLGIYFVKHLYSSSQDITKIPLKNFYSKLEDIGCDSTQRVCVGQNRKVVAVGKSVVYTLIINNHFSDEREFEITMEPTKGFKPNGDAIENFDSIKGKIKSITKSRVTIDRYSKEKIPIAVQPWFGTPHGTYNILVTVKDKDPSKDDSDFEDYAKVYLYLVVK